MIDLLHKIYRIRTCSRNLPRDIGKDRPCLYYHIRQCDRPCQGFISQEDYQKQIKEVLDFLSGKYDPVTKLLTDRMYAASEEMEFEKAAEYRDLLKSVRQIAQKQKITSQSMDDRDIIAMAKDERDVVVQVFFVRDGRLIGREHFHVEAGRTAETNSQILNGFVKQFYAGTPFIPHEIWCQEGAGGCRGNIQLFKRQKRAEGENPRSQEGEKEKLVEACQKECKAGARPGQGENQEGAARWGAEPDRRTYQAFQGEAD